MQAATGESVEVAFVDQGYTGEKPAAAAREHGIELEVVKLPEAKRGFVLLHAVGSSSVPLPGDPLPQARQGLRALCQHSGRPALVAFVCLMLKKAAQLATGS